MRPIGTRTRSVGSTLVLAALVATSLVAPASVGAAGPRPAPGLAHAPAADTAPGPATTVLVRYRDGASAIERGRARGKADVTRERGRSDLRLDVVRPARGQSVANAVAALNADPAVELAEPNARLALAAGPSDEPFVPVQWGLENHGGDCIGTAMVAPRPHLRQRRRHRRVLRLVQGDGRRHHDRDPRRRPRLQPTGARRPGMGQPGRDGDRRRQPRQGDERRRRRRKRLRRRHQRREPVHDRRADEARSTAPTWTGTGPPSRRSRPRPPTARRWRVSHRDASCMAVRWLIMASATASTTRSTPSTTPSTTAPTSSTPRGAATRTAPFSRKRSSGRTPRVC